MDEIKQQIRDLNPADWQDFLTWVVRTEKPRREAAPEVEAGRAELIEEVWQAHPDTRPDYAPSDASTSDWPAWQQPTSALGSYPPGAGVTYNGALWENTLPMLNPHTPGAVGAGWVRHITTPDTIDDTSAPGSQSNPIPWAVGIAATPAGGDGVTWVTHGGHLWECLTSHITHEGWPPSAATHAVWRDHGPTPAPDDDSPDDPAPEPGPAEPPAGEAGD